jgi:hypothetical protein
MWLPSNLLKNKYFLVIFISFINFIFYSFKNPNASEILY